MKPAVPLLSAGAAPNTSRWSDVARMTTEESTLTDGENLGTAHTEEAGRWHAAYRELIAYLDGLIARTEAEPAAGPVTPSELADLHARRERWTERAEFWGRRCCS